MTERRLKRIQKKAPPKKTRPFRYFLLLAVLIIIFFYFLPSHWNKSSSLNLIVAGKEKVYITVFDPDLNKITVISIPNNTQVTASNQLGTWKIGSIWQLGNQENLGGNLLAMTVMKSFGLPIDEWSSSEGQNLASKNQLVKLKSIFIPFSTSLTFKDKIKLATFSFSNRNNLTNINLEDTNFLQKTRLTSGEDGYLIRSEAPPSILHLFADPVVIDESARIGIVNSTGTKFTASEIARIIHALGSKIYFVEDTNKNDSDCVVATKEMNHTATRLANLLRCELVTETSNNLDINLTIGENFAKRF